MYNSAKCIFITIFTHKSVYAYSKKSWVKRTNSESYENFFANYTVRSSWIRVKSGRQLGVRIPIVEFDFSRLRMVNEIERWTNNRKYIRAVLRSNRRTQNVFILHKQEIKEQKFYWRYLTKFAVYNSKIQFAHNSLYFPNIFLSTTF